MSILSLHVGVAASKASGGTSPCAHDRAVPGGTFRTHLWTYPAVFRTHISGHAYDRSSGQDRNRFSRSVV